MVQLLLWIKSNFVKVIFTILAVLLVCAIPYILLYGVRGISWAQEFMGVYLLGLIVPAISFLLVPKEKFRTLFYFFGYGWIILILTICLVWSLHVAFKFSMVPRDWLWGYIEPGLGGLGLLVFSSIFYFGIAQYLKDGFPANTDKSKFCFGLFLVITICMTFGFFNWIDGLLDYNTKLLNP